MAGENAISGYYIGKWRVTMVVRLLRVFALFATAAATIVMALNKQTHTFAVATIGNTPVKIALTAKFQHTPANIMFVVANGVATIHSLLMLSSSFVSPKYNFKGLRFLIVAALDMIAIAVVSGAATSVAFMGELARNGNSHARWNKVCDNFERFCDHASGAMLASYIAIFFMMLVNMFNMFQLIGRLNNHNHPIATAA
ncbi:CASP-like protein 1B2 [Rutidosis leptorrhynchoides]|uniref:CASP-like protein 1B2 n=1 Tax=Rutidosis leptorrhynchoides TaxID=125765 RepID=UPI003A990A04